MLAVTVTRPPTRDIVTLDRRLAAAVEMIAASGRGPDGTLASTRALAYLGWLVP